MCGRFFRVRIGVDYLEPLMNSARDPRGSASLDLFQSNRDISPETEQPVLKVDGPSWKGGASTLSGRRRAKCR
ncbi:hypothetical protein SAMN05216551_105288 [Chitinasiproducens palmae]|uniref:Uncharacterized protein n=1 Tax=Chitinasiproducens palmae TaxID=1770053 RepID=A0A1H2PPM3_9BURK|nr:hypothetical protein SAMN05216551_105288 [Chitinasiproducens palmae]